MTARRNAFAMYRTLVGIGLVCALLLVLVHQWTSPAIARARADALREAVKQVLPGAVSSEAFQWDASSRFVKADQASGASDLVFAARDATGTLVGVAFQARIVGYQDEIVALFGYSPTRAQIVGFRVLESRETPGLGDKIETDPHFLANFEQLDVTLTPDGSSLAHPIESVPRDAKQHPWQVDAISGATISSRAVTSMLGDAAGTWVPRIARHAEGFRR